MADLARLGGAAPPGCLHCAALLTLNPNGEWQHADSDCYYAEQPYVADRRIDAQITLRLDPDDHPLVCAAHGDIIIALGDPGAGVAGVRTQVVVAGATARRWFSDLIGQLTPALAAADTQRDT